jgi:phosphohistidine phosphatase
VKLYFLRHGDAEPGVNTSDHNRELTPRGIERLQTAGRVMARLGLKPARLYSSPRVRARQTADIASEALHVNVEVREELNFGFNVGSLPALLDGCATDDEVMLVGHEPTFSNAVGALTNADIDMKKGGLARVDLLDPANTSGVLIWLIAPKVFDSLGTDAG